MATISGTATKLSDSSAVVGGKITLINSGTNTVIATTTTGALGAFEFLGVTEGITVHVVGEWDDAGTLYNAKSQPFISTGTGGDPGTIMTNEGVAATSVWIKSDADPTTFTTRDAAGTLHITAWGSVSPAGISGTSPTTESQQPVYNAVSGQVEFIRANATHLIIPTGVRELLSNSTSVYTFSIAIPSYTQVSTNDWVLSSRAVAAEETQLGSSDSVPKIRAMGTIIGDFVTPPTYMIATWKVDNSTLSYRVMINEVAATSGTFVASHAFRADSGPVHIGRLVNSTTVAATFNLKEFVFIPAYISNDDMDDLHQRMLTLYKPA